MVVMTVENAAPKLRGRLRRWLVELHPGVYAGKVSPRIRDLLWDEATTKYAQGKVSQAWSNRSEQGYSFRIHGDKSRQMVDFDGLSLVLIRVNSDTEPVNCDVHGFTAENRQNSS